MTEPIYTYVKGKGWLVCSSTVTMHCGTLVNLEKRKPNIGEIYVWAYQRDYNVAEGSLDEGLEMSMNYWKDKLQYYNLDALEVYTTDDVEFFSRRHHEASFLVITKV